MQFSEDELVLHVLGDAPAELSERIVSAARSDESLRQRIEQLSEMLGMLESPQPVFEPPADLLDSTLARIADATAPQPAQLTPTVNSKSRGFFWDSPALSLSLAALCCLILPAVVRARYSARKLQCAENLQTAGRSLLSYASLDPEGRFPQIPTSGSGAFAGFFTVQLVEAGMPLRARDLQCSSRIGIDDQQSANPFGSLNASTVANLPSPALDRFQRVAAGNYAYSLGVNESGRVVAPKLLGASHMPVLADAPIVIRQTNEEQFVAHEGRGFNVLYRDGRIVFVDLNAFDFASGKHWQQSEADAGLDYPFRNQQGSHEFGVSPSDASLAPSHFPPVSRQ